MSETAGETYPWTVLGWTAASSTIVGLVLATVLGIIDASVGSAGFIGLGYVIFGSIGLLAGALGGLAATVASAVLTRPLAAIVGAIVSGGVAWLACTSVPAVAPLVFASLATVVVFATLIGVSYRGRRAG